MSKVFTSIACDLAPRLGTLKASAALHRILLWAMVRAPLMFYDQTPIGRILSRFSSDQEAVDNKIPQIVSDGLWCLFEVNLQYFLLHVMGLSWEVYCLKTCSLTRVFIVLDWLCSERFSLDSRAKFKYRFNRCWQLEIEIEFYLSLMMVECIILLKMLWRLENNLLRKKSWELAKLSVLSTDFSCCSCESFLQIFPSQG